MYKVSVLHVYIIYSIVYFGYSQAICDAYFKTPGVDVLLHPLALISLIFRALSGFWDSS